LIVHADQLLGEIYLAVNYLPVEISKFRSAIRDIHFDVYLKVSEGNYAHVFSRNTGLDYRRLAAYIQKGVEHLYIRELDHDLFNDYINRTANSVFQDPDTSNEKKIATLLNMTEQNMAEVFVQLNVPSETANNTKKVVTNYVDLMTDNPKSLSVILRLASHGEYIYYHSIATAIFSMFIAKATGQFNRRTLELVGLGGFLHDIGCTQLPKEITEADDDLTAAQWKQMRTHPKLGLQMIEKTQSIPDEVRYIVYQHHEEPSGRGYPNGLKGPVIYYPAKIVAMADCFSALISKRPFRAAYTIEQAIGIMQNENGKFDRDLLNVLSTIFTRKAKSAA